MSENPNETSQRLDQMDRDTFAEQLHTKCKVQTSPTDAIELELIEVADRPTSPRMECFSVLFVGPASPVLPQRIWKLEHPHLGPFDLFLTPLGVDESGTTYEAVFHRRKKEP